MRTEMKALGALLIAAVLVEPVASASHAAACNTSGVNSAFAAASTCVAGRKSGRPAAPGTSGSSSDTTKFCQYLAVTSVCFGSCACKSVDLCDGKTKGVAPKANQTQQALFHEVCNAWNDNNCIPEKGEFQCGKNQFLVPTTTPAPDCKEAKTCVVCGSGDTDSQCVHCSSDTYQCNSKDCKFDGGSCVPGNGLMTGTVSKASTFFLTLSVTLPYTKDQFDKSKQDKYKTAVANAAGTIAGNVEIVKITDARRRAGKVNVETKILAADQLGLNSLRYTLASCHDDGTAKCKIDKALAREGLEKSTAAAEPLMFTSTGGVQTPVWALSLLATTAAMMISWTTTYTHLCV